MQINLPVLLRVVLDLLRFVLFDCDSVRGVLVFDSWVLDGNNLRVETCYDGSFDDAGLGRVAVEYGGVFGVDETNVFENFEVLFTEIRYGDEARHGHKVLSDE
jgi:hypothetical protein